MYERKSVEVLPQRLFSSSKRVVIYCRTSTHTREQLNSMSNQVSYLTRFVASKYNWQLVDAYIDFQSGSGNARRVEFQRLIEDGCNKKFDIVICKSVSRFGRNVIDSLTAIRKLKAYGVEVIFELEELSSNNPDHEFLLSIASAVAAEDNLNRRESIEWGIKRRLENGSSSIYTRPCYGYKKDANGELIIDEGQEEIVKLIYELYLSGKSIVGIIAELKVRGISSPTGKSTWPKRSIELMLSNEKYTGSVIVFKTYSAGTPKSKRIINKGEHPRYVAANSNPIIIPKEIFDLVQQEKVRRSNVVADEDGTRRREKKYSSKSNDPKRQLLKTDYAKNRSANEKAIFSEA